MIYVKTLGSFSVSWNGKRITGLSRSGDTQIEALLQPLLHCHSRGVDRALLLKQLFRDRDIQNASHSLNVLLYNLRKRLRSAGLPDVNYVQRRGDVYFWTPEIPVTEDAEEFEKMYEAAGACADRQEKLRLYIEACRMYHGEFLGAQTDAIWAVQEARHYEKIFTECTERAADMLREEKDYRRLEQVGKYAAQAQPFFQWERLTMEALIGQGRMMEARSLYLATEKYYRTEMGLALDERMTALYQRVRMEDADHASYLDLIWRQMKESSEETGGYLCSYPVFEGLCQMRERQKTRMGMPPYMMYFGLSESCDLSVANDADTERLEQALVRSLRRGDAVTRFGGRQFLVLLGNATESYCASVAERVADRFRKLGGSAEIEHRFLCLDQSRQENASQTRRGKKTASGDPNQLRFTA